MNKKKKIVILTGAGISKESGIDTFRDAGGVWTRVRLEDVATPEGFSRDPQKVHSFYNERRRQLISGDIQPNAAHHALARLEREWPDSVLLVTQNIDDLHGRAGQKNLIHMHGELLKAICSDCWTVHRWIDDLFQESPCPSCEKRFSMRPHVVWFGEIPLEMDRIQQALSDCDIFISIGTSGSVYPAAGFVQLARIIAGAHTVELNLEASGTGSMFNECHHGPATLKVPEYIEKLLSS